jgi:hypothetical protein
MGGSEAEPSSMSESTARFWIVALIAIEAMVAAAWEGD